MTQSVARELRLVITDRVSREGKAIGSVRLSVRPSVSNLSFELTDL